MTIWHPTWIEIDTEQFRKNVRLIKTFVHPALYCLPIKANAYGHGLSTIGKIAEEEGVDYLAVAHASEGAELRMAGIKIPILVLGAIHKEQVQDLLKHDLEVSISSRLKANLIKEQSTLLQKTCKVHIEIDTGMHRTGMRPETALKLYEEFKTTPFFEIVGVYSHFASTGEQGKTQAHTFNETCNKMIPPSKERLIKHIGNSQGTLEFPEAHLDMVRPALLTFGYGAKREALKEIKPCFSLKSRVAYFKVVEKGSGISYNHTFRSEKPSRIVTIPIGYGDGYRRDLSNKGEVLIRKKRYPIVGTICMDQFMVDIGQDDVFPGDEVVLIGSQGNEEITLEEVAKHCNTIPYEILCGLNNRVPRIYR